MRILYGISGVGLGHATRVEEIVSFLENQNHEVLILTDDEAYNFLKNKKNIYKINGFPLYFKNGYLLVFKSLIGGFKSLFKNIKNRKKINKKIKEFSPQICITDMEPFTSLISYIYKLPLINISNQYSLIDSKIKIDKKYLKGQKLANLSIKLVSPKVNEFIVISFLKNKSTSNKINYITPIIRSKIKKLKVIQEDFILVYSTKFSKDLIDNLKQIDEKFIFYNYDKIGIEKNIYFKKISDEFIDDLAKTKAIIGSSGFSLISEAIYLKKPCFAIPLKNHFEQTYNALFIKNNDLGDFSFEPNIFKINSFIKNLDKYKKNLDKMNFDSEKSLKEINKIIKKYDIKK